MCGPSLTVIPLSPPTHPPLPETNNTRTWCIIKQQCRLSRLYLEDNSFRLLCSTALLLKGFDPNEKDRHCSWAHIWEYAEISACTHIHVRVVSATAHRDPLWWFMHQMALAACVSVNFSHAILFLSICHFRLVGGTFFFVFIFFISPPPALFFFS